VGEKLLLLLEEQLVNPQLKLYSFNNKIKWNEKSDIFNFIL
jgi:hypothetical protein